MSPIFTYDLFIVLVLVVTMVKNTTWVTVTDISVDGALSVVVVTIVSNMARVSVNRILMNLILSIVRTGWKDNPSM